MGPRAEPTCSSKGQGGLDLTRSVPTFWDEFLTKGNSVFRIIFKSYRNLPADLFKPQKWEKRDLGTWPTAHVSHAVAAPSVLTRGFAIGNPLG